MYDDIWCTDRYVRQTFRRVTCFSKNYWYRFIFLMTFQIFTWSLTYTYNQSIILNFDRRKTYDRPKKNNILTFFSLGQTKTMQQHRSDRSLAGVKGKIYNIEKGSRSISPLKKMTTKNEKMCCARRKCDHLFQD